MANLQLIPPGDGKHSTTKVNGRTYTATPGMVMTVPDFDAVALQANGWIPCAPGGVGSTAQRPAAPKVGTAYLDTTVGGIVIWDGVAWRHHATGAGV